MKNVFLLISIFLVSVSANAGYYSDREVVVQQNVKTAYGSFYGAQKSSDNLQYIGCQYIGSATNPYATCSARTATGSTAFCTTFLAHHHDQIRGLSSASYLYFRWNDQGQCDYIFSSINSLYAK